MTAVEIDNLKQQSRKLLPNQKIELIKFLAESLAPEQGAREPQYLVYGKYRNTNRKMSAEADFKIAEWHPTETELNGD